MIKKRSQLLDDKAVFSPAKIIISGEHSVVYGEPAIVAALDIGVYAWVSDINLPQDYSKELKKYISDILKIINEKKHTQHSLSVEQVQLNIEVAIGAGLGTSAAIAHAVILAVLKHLDISLSQDEIFELVLTSETLIHGNPSGVDPSAVVYGGVQVFQKNKKTNSYSKSVLKLSRPYSFFLINSGVATESTGEMVSGLADRLQKDTDLQDTITEIGTITTQLQSQLESGAFSGELLQKNNQLLQKFGLIGERAQEIIESVTELGYFAKISGAGGIKTGSGMILCYSPDENYVKLQSFCQERSLEYLQSTIK